MRSASINKIRPLTYSLAILILFGLSISPAAAQSPPRNIILFIADGGGAAQFTIARDFKRDHLRSDSALVFDSLQTGSVRTFASNSRITDSAAGATAYSCGLKTYNGAIAVDTLRRPCATLLEAAEAAGMATGLVATSRITHATPASFSAHVPERWMENAIAEQQIRQGIEVMLGGGRRHFLPEDEGGSREDGRNLLDEARDEGYQVISTRDELHALDDGPVLGLFEMAGLPYEIDRNPDEQPSLAELTRTALDLLEGDPEGFFLMVEGSRIDHAAHNNDAAGMLHDVLAYEQAFAAALSFARRDAETLIVVTSDHETGGLSLARGGHYAWYPDTLAQVKASLETLTTTLVDHRNEQAEILEELAGIEELSDEDAERLAAAIEWGEVKSVLADILSKRARIGWTTTGHTAVDVPLYAYGPGRRHFFGNVNNTYVGQKIADIMGFDLEELTRQLRGEARDLLLH